MNIINEHFYHELRIPRKMERGEGVENVRFFSPSATKPINNYVVI